MPETLDAPVFSIETSPPVEVGRTVAVLRFALAELLRRKQVTQEEAVDALRFIDSL